MDNYIIYVDNQPIKYRQEDFIVKDNKVYICKFEVIKKEEKNGKTIIYCEKCQYNPSQIEGGNNDEQTISIKEFYDQYLSQQDEKYRNGLKQILSYNPEIDYKVFQKYGKDTSFVKYYESVKIQNQDDNADLNVTCNDEFSNDDNDDNNNSNKTNKTDKTDKTDKTYDINVVCKKYFNGSLQEIQKYRDQMISGGCNCNSGYKGGNIQMSNDFINDYLGGKCGYDIVQNEQKLDQQKLQTQQKYKKYYSGGLIKTMTYKSGYDEQPLPQTQQTQDLQQSPQSPQQSQQSQSPQQPQQQIKIQSVSNSSSCSSSSSSFSSSNSESSNLESSNSIQGGDNVFDYQILDDNNDNESE